MPHRHGEDRVPRKRAVNVLYMKKPPSFKYKRHLFSITSAPGDDYLSVHIRTLGDWTSELRNLFGKALQAEVASNKAKLARLRGPEGLEDGIGATSFISILKHLLNNKKSNELNCSTTVNLILYVNNRSWIKAYFYWVTREQGSIEWFKGVLDDIAESDRDNVIEMHNYLTSVYMKKGMQGRPLIAMLQSLQHAKNGLGFEYKCVTVILFLLTAHFAYPNTFRKAKLEKGVLSDLSNTHKNSRIDPIRAELHPWRQQHGAIQASKIGLLEGSLQAAENLAGVAWMEAERCLVASTTAIGDEVASLLRIVARPARMDSVHGHCWRGRSSSRPQPLPRVLLRAAGQGTIGHFLLWISDSDKNAEGSFHRVQPHVNNSVPFPEGAFLRWGLG
ncbi:hypothetical protein EJB05_15659, partial [Eragrostis curvula]